MTTLPFRSVTATLLLCLALPAAGQTDITRLHLDDAIRTAVANNHDLTAARLEVERADARVREAWGSALPRLDLKARYTRALKKPVFFLPDFFNPGSDKVNAIEIGSTHAFDMTVTADQVLFNSTVFIGVGAARIYARGAREVYRAKQVEVVTTARKAYYGVLVAREAFAMMQQNMKNAEDNLTNVQLLAAQGLVSEYDLLRAQVAHDNLRPEVIRAENGFRQAVNALKMVMGLPVAVTVGVADTLGFQPVDPGMAQEAHTTVLSSNPSLAALRTQAEVQDAFVSVERSGYLPTVSAFGTYQYTAQNNQFLFSLPDFINSATVGLSLSLNLFSGLQTNARVEAAQLEVRKAQEQIAGMENGLQANTESILLQLERARQRIDASARTVEQAEKGYRIASTRYRNGAGTQLEVNDAQLAVTQAKVNRIQALYDYLVASADLDQALGRIPTYVPSMED